MERKAKGGKRGGDSRREERERRGGRKGGAEGRERVASWLLGGWTPLPLPTPVRGC